MKKLFLSSLFLMGGFWCFGQQDSIRISAKLSADAQSLIVAQQIVYHNPFDKPTDKIKLQNWVAAYQNRSTPLLKRKLQDRKKDLYFAKANELGALKNLHIEGANNSKDYEQLNEEFLYFYLDKMLAPKEAITINLTYEIKLPNAKFTGYGVGEKDINLKYFFIVPDSFENENQYPKHFLDIEQNLNSNSYWKVHFELSELYKSESSLVKTNPHTFEGVSTNDPEFFISYNKIDALDVEVDNETIKLVFGYAITEEDRQSLAFFAPLHFKFLKKRFGNLPKKIFISERYRSSEKFVGIDDIKFWKFHYKLFSDAEKVDLHYFSILSKQLMDALFINEKNEDHWLKNGLQTYSEIQYIKEFYPHHKLLGDLPEQAKILGMKPLKIFHASKLKLTERYPLAYQYILTQNLDQSINSNFEDLSKFNTEAISHFETGLLFNFLADQLGHFKFDRFLNSYFSKHYQQTVVAQDFLSALETETGGNSTFLKSLIEEKNRINFNLKRFTRQEDHFVVKVNKVGKEKIPFKLQTESESIIKETEWNLADKASGQYSIQSKDADKLIVNDEFIFPETNFRDNYLYTKGLFSNMKQIRLKLIKDVPNPEYNELYISPRASFNAYDKVMLGFNLVNRGVFDQKFVYTLTPYYSTGTGELTGKAGASYNFLPADSFFRSWQLGGGASYFHYDYDLAYQTYNVFTNFLFNKNPRSAVSRSLYFSYAHFQKDLDEKRILAKEYGKYNLWSLGYSYNDNAAIHEKYFNTGFQWMEDFQKWSTEAFYRWEYAKNKKISFRFFGGLFLNNKTQNDIFDYGISRVSNYAFSYGLLGQSATTGILSQQFVLAEGGFKSDFKTKSNQWITSINVDAHLWKMFNLYADTGLYKSRGASTKFLWDSGVKLKIIPDFFEIYFPIQSSLGFEPAMKDYGYRIRYTLIFNLSALTSNLRRGVY
ncbi:aminopeptidase [Chryseobacterium sp. POL2]|uniref:aminopeptidase n=1 Tax=Chryseobacterium sp. POL2 TaxID=2713414 RepID=UPI001E636462|nr:aminopeptidase [Chryseobacterium sp. POL2]